MRGRSAGVYAWEVGGQLLDGMLHIGDRIEALAGLMEHSTADRDDWLELYAAVSALAAGVRALGLNIDLTTQDFDHHDAEEDEEDP